jgi:Phosphohistidine phosphatase SixA
MKFIIILIFSLSLASCSHSYYIVRHAEKAETTDSVSMNMQNDLPLSEAGKVRALVLKDLLDKKNIDYIFSTNTVRTRSTAKPLSDAVGVPVQLYSQDTINSFIQRLKSIESGNVLIVGHSNTVDDIVNLLAGRTKIPGDLKETEYDNLYIIKYTNFLGKRISFRQKTYGYPSNP